MEIFPLSNYNDDDQFYNDDDASNNADNDNDRNDGDGLPPCHGENDACVTESHDQHRQDPGEAEEVQEVTQLLQVQH